MRGLLKPLLLLAVVLLVPISAYAQAAGAIAGVVRDPSNAVIPGVTVEVSSPALIEKVRSTTTDSNGRYQITALPVGTYKITFALQGFNTVARENIVLNADFTAPVNVQLAVGNLTDVVTVVAETPAVDVQNARVQYVFSGSDIADLPTERDLGGLLNLVPSISNPNGSCIGGVGLFCNGIAPAFNSHVSGLDADGQNQGRIVVDGMTINRGGTAQGINLNTGATNGISFDTANVQELTFTLSGALGESETGGASITIVPRTGGNRFAGSYFTSYLDDKFFGNNRKTRLIGIPDGTNDVVYDYDINGSFGGPIKKDKLWFFVNGRTRKDEKYPNNGLVGGFANLNEGQFAMNYQPLRGDNSKDYWLTYTNEQKNLAGRVTLQLSQRNKFNLAWDEQDACTNPCGGMINIVDSPESYFSLQNRPNRLRSASWTNPFTNKILFEAGLTAINTTQNSTEHREYKNRPELPRICEQGSTTGMDAFATKVNTTITDSITSNGGAGQCSIFFTMISGSVNEAFNNNSGFQKQVDDTYRSRASASYVTGSHNAKIGWEGAYFGEKTTNPVNQQRASYHYGTPDVSCLTTPSTPANPWPCGNMTLLWPNDPTNRDRRPKPIGLDYNTGAGTANEHVWFGAIYLQDQWTLKRFTISGAVRYDHAKSGYGETCFGPDKYVPIQEDGTNSWCSTPADGVSYNDVTPRWGVAWDVFGTGKTSVKYNMGKYLQAAGFGGLYTDNNSARRTNNQLTRLWDDVNGNRLVDCDLLNPNPQSVAGGDICGTMLQSSGVNAGQPTTDFATFGRPPTATQLFTANSFCGRTENSSQLHRDYCAASGQNLLSGSGVRRSEWQFGIGVQHEILPRLSGEVTYNWRKYQNLTDSDTVGRGCDYFLGADPDQCFDNLLNFVGVNHDFYSFTTPVDPRLPNGGGYVIRGNANQKVRGNLPGSGDVTTIQEVLEYTWNGVDTNWVYRGPKGIRIAGGTSTGRSVRDTCRTDGDNPNVKGRADNLYGGGCKVNNPFQTNVRANGSYTIPWVDVLAGVVFQSRPGSALIANLNVPFAAAVWEPTATPGRAGQPFNGTSLTTGVNTQQVNLLDTGDLYGERQNNWDLTLRKNFRFAGKRANFGFDIYNIFNSDAATGYVNTYTAAYDAATGVWTPQNDDNPATTVVEGWGNINGIVNPRFFRISMSLDF